MAALTRLLVNPYGPYLAAPKAGQQVRLMVGDGIGTERVWVDVKMALLGPDGKPTLFAGIVKSTCFYVDGYMYGDKVIFQHNHVHEYLGWRGL